MIAYQLEIVPHVVRPPQNQMMGQNALMELTHSSYPIAADANIKIEFISRRRIREYANMQMRHDPTSRAT